MPDLVPQTGTTDARAGGSRRLLILAVVAVGAAIVVALSAAGGPPSGWASASVGPEATIAIPEDWVVAHHDDGSAVVCDAARGGVLVQHAGLEDPCDGGGPDRLIVTGGVPPVDPVDLVDADRIDVAGAEARSFEDPADSSQVLVSVAHDASLRIPGDVDRERVDEVIAELERHEGPDADSVHLVPGSPPPGEEPGSDAQAWWVLDGEARVYPLVADAGGPIDGAFPWPLTDAETVVHAWAADDRMQVAAGDATGTTRVLDEPAVVGSAAFTPGADALLWVERDDEGWNLGVAAWGSADELADGAEPGVARHALDDLAGTLDDGEVHLETVRDGSDTVVRFFDPDRPDAETYEVTLDPRLLEVDDTRS